MTAPTAPAAPDPEFDACRRILAWLAAEGTRRRSLNQLSQKATGTYDDLVLALPPAAEADLDALVDPALADATLHPNWVHGPPGYDDDPALLPAVTARWRRTPQGVSAQFMVVLAVAGTRRTKPNGLRGTAFRFESGEPGTHDYDHVQPSLSLTMGGGAPLLQGLLAPPSTTTPALPLDSAGPVGLLVCVMRSVYGTTRWNKYLGGNPDLAAAVRPFLPQMPALDHRRRAAAPASAAGPRPTPGPPTPGQSPGV